MLVTEEFRSKDDLFSFLTETYVRPKPPALHCFPFFLDDEFSVGEAIELARRRGLHASLRPAGEDLYLLDVGVRTSYQTGFFFPLNGSWMFLCDGQGSRLRSTLRAFARNLFPVLNMAYLPSKSMLQLMEQIQNMYENLLVTDGTIWTQAQTIRNWRREPTEFSSSMMDRLSRRDQGKWTGISFKCMADNGEVFACRVYEHGHITFYAGQFPEFYSDVLLPYVANSADFREKLKGRERKEADGDIELSPVSLEFPERLTQSEMELLKGGIIGKYVAAVTHPGNPMLVMHLSDRQDGSMYDIYMYDAKLEIVPLEKASSSSVSRLIALVSDILPTGTPEVV